jgi:hypothetical protein
LCVVVVVVVVGKGSAQRLRLQQVLRHGGFDAAVWVAVLASVAVQTLKTHDQSPQVRASEALALETRYDKRKL